MAKNSNLHKAKTAKNDEFYTLLPDVARELMHYKEHFRDRVILCNCDDPVHSAFWKYFHLNFAELGLRRLISTHYHRTEPTYKMIYEGGNDTDTESGTKAALLGNGDFRSQECIDLLKEADIVATNPPFSMFREYAAQLVEHGKKFVIIGNMNAITYKEFFPLIRDNKVWSGYSFNKTLEFIMPESYELKGKAFVDSEGRKHGFVPSVCWFTNLDIQKRHEDLILWRRYYDDNGNPLPESEKLYPKYDNYDAIEVSKVADIPCDYYGVMGVPISFMEKYCPEQFEIIDGREIALSARQQNKNTMLLKDGDTAINGKPTYARVCIRYTKQWIADHAEDFREA